MTDSFYKLLAAPCKFCGYNGPGYWQKGSHGADCPWREIGGDKERLNQLPEEIEKRIKFWNESREIDKAQFEHYEWRPATHKEF